MKSKNSLKSTSRTSLNESQKVDEAEYLTAKDNDSDDEDKNISLA